MKLAFAIAVALLTLGAAPQGRADLSSASSGPSSRSLDRYSHIWTTKPFVAATVVAPQAESVVQRYAITGYAQYGGSDVLFLLDRVSLLRFTVTDKKSENGVDLVAVTEREASGRLKARIRAAGEMAEIAFDANSAAAMGDPGMASPGAPVAAAGISAPPPPPSSASGPGALLDQKRPANAPRPVRVIQRRAIQTQ